MTPPHLTSPPPLPEVSNRVKIKPQRVRVDRNPLKATFCPNYNYVYFSSHSGLSEVVAHEMKQPRASRKYVAMWPDFDPDTKTFDFYKPAGTPKLWWWLDALLKLAGLDQATPHSIRSSACIWALRCYVEADYVKEGGRWLGTGKSWKKYFERGSALKEQNRKKPSGDPIFKFWVWQYNVVPDVDA